MKIIVESGNCDANYYTKISTITKEELDIIKPLIKAILSFKKIKNYRTELYVDKDEQRPENMYSEFPREVHELFSKFVDTGGDDGIDRIYNIEVYSPKKL